MYQKKELTKMLNDNDLDDFFEEFTFTYNNGDMEACISQTYNGGSALSDKGGPLELFKKFLNSAGFSTDVTFVLNRGTEYQVEVE
tara:strand:- start:2007 stop:2261 length:255 start_codon:yes stop_codon:yes gene_type:complete